MAVGEAVALGPRARAGASEADRVRPIVGWAWVGAAFIAVEVWVMGRWILSGPVRTPAGPSHVPANIKIGAAILQVAFPLLALFVVYRFVVRPWRRDRRLSLDGILVIVISPLLLYWQDPLSNYPQAFWTY